MQKIKLIALRVNKGMSREQVADAINRSESTIKKWEKGETFPIQPDIEKLCALYGVTYDMIDFIPPKNE